MKRPPDPPADLVVSTSEDGELAVLSYTNAPAGRGKLTQAEREVALLVLEGRSNAEIGRLRGRAPRTIANQIARVFRKLGVNSRSELVVRYGAELLLL